MYINRYRIILCILEQQQAEVSKQHSILIYAENSLFYKVTQIACILNGMGINNIFCDIKLNTFDLTTSAAATSAKAINFTLFFSVPAYVVVHFLVVNKNRYLIKYDDAN